MKKLAVCGLLIAIAVIYMMAAPRPALQASSHVSNTHATLVTLPAPTARTASSHPGAWAYNVMAAPTISAARINAILCAASSPACGTGSALYALGVQYGINPIYALAFFQHESSFGRYGVARVTLSLGNIRCTPGWARCLDGFRAYPSWQVGYADWYQLIRYYCRTLNRCTIDTIIPMYAPSVENDTAGYIAAIKQAVDEWSGQR